jgi:aminoglycoside phosphotransferase
LYHCFITAAGFQSLVSNCHCKHVFKKFVTKNAIYYLKLPIAGVVARWNAEKARIQWKEEDDLEMSKRGSVEDEWTDRETGRKGL